MHVDIVRIDGRDYNNPPSQPDNNIFVDRRKNSEFLLMILAGYKSFLYKDVFARVKAFTPKNFDICIMSSGLFDETLNKIATENDWSYLSTAQNNIPLIQNLAIMLHPQAQFLFKMDEDIFITEGVFNTLMKTADYVQKHRHYNVGFVAPLIPINPYGYVRLLEKLGLIETYEKMFGPVYYGVNNGMITTNLDVAKFFWGEGGFVPSIDKMNSAFQIQKMSYSICSIRFAIGMIMFHRDLWISMNGLKMLSEGDNYGPGLDEWVICQFCVMEALAMVVAENAVVGHLCFRGLTSAMKEYYLTHREIFRCPK